MTQIIKLIQKSDWILNGLIAILSLSGLMVLLSSNYDLFIKQIIFIGVGFFFLIIAPILNLKHFINYRWLIFVILIFSIILLLSVHFFGIEVNNSKSWLDFGLFRLQPSEFAKVAIVIVLSAFFSKRHISIKRLDIIFASFGYVAIPGALILMEPDLGSALIIFGIWFGFLLVAGLSLKHIITAIGLFIIMGALMWNFGLRDHQRNRIMVLFNPEADPLGVSYNILQSKNAIGSAGLFGKGFRQGEIVRLGFLPAAQTDFVFSAFIEEWGIISGGIIILMFIFLIWRLSFIGARFQDNFSKFICLGTIIFIVLQFIINIGSAIGLAPVIGVVLPFMSAGGSNLIAVMILMGIIQNMQSRLV